MALGIGDENFAPAFDIQVATPGSAGSFLDVGVTQFIQRVEYESSDGMADEVKLTISNPDFLLSDANVFVPGNEISVWLGYGGRQRMAHVGRAVIVKGRPNFPKDGMPSVEVVARTRDVMMMDHGPEKSKVKGSKGGRNFSDSRFSDAVERRARDYKFTADVDQTLESPHDFPHKAGVTDYAFVKAMAGITGFVFWVDGDEKGKWTLHFKNPEKKIILQEKEYTFTYRNGDLSTLLSYESEFLVQGFHTKLKVESKDPKTGKLFEVEVEDNSQDNAPDLAFADDVTEKVTAPIPSAASVKVFFNDFSFDLQPNKKFKTQSDVVRWAKQWFRRSRENFILAKGEVIGLETLMARQTHKLEGLGKTLDGAYYFSNVRHIMDRENGYTCEFNARKVL